MTDDLLQLDFGLDVEPSDTHHERPDDALRAALEILAEPDADRLGFFVAKARAGASFQDFVTLALFRFGRAESLTVVSVFLSLPAVHALTQWLKIATPKRLLVLLGKQMTQTRYDHITKALRECVAQAKVPTNIKYVTHHTKFVTAKRGQKACVVASSANLNRNENAENYAISEDPETCGAFSTFAERNLGAKVLRRIQCP